MSRGAPAHLQCGIEVGFGLFEVAQDGKDGEHGRVIVSHYGSTCRCDDVISIQHQIIQRLLQTNTHHASRVSIYSA